MTADPVTVTVGTRLADALELLSLRKISELPVVDGEGKVVLDGIDKEFEKGEIAFVPAGVQHNVINTDDEPMKLFTIYAPPQHAAGTVHRTKAAAEQAEREAPASVKE